MEEYITYLKKFQIAVAIIILSFVVIGLLISKTYPEFEHINSIQNDYKSRMSELSDAERRLSDLKDTLAREKAEDEHAIKAFFKPMNYGVDTDTAISEEFEEILQLLRENKVKARSLEFEPDPKDDNFVKHVGDKYYVSKLKAVMIATYPNFENFLRDLYKHEHFLDISKISVTPYPKNKRILIIDFELKLYAQKNDSAAIDFKSNSVVPQEPVNEQEVQQPKVEPQPKSPSEEVKTTTEDPAKYEGDEMTRKHKVYEDKK